MIRPDLRLMVHQLRGLALRALARMYVPERRLFAFRLRRTDGGNRREGVSRRYTAVALIGLAGELPSVAGRVLAGHDVSEVCGRLLEDLDVMDELGEVALSLWASRILGHPDAPGALERLAAMQPASRPHPTAELAWSLTALSVQGDGLTDIRLADRIAERLMASFEWRSGLFPHWPRGAQKSWARSHVTCFADLVYPIQALSHYHLATGSAGAKDAACCCARQVCRLQGAEGQWWWHYDVRTGRIVEAYPVYSVHQDSMAPMALLALQNACGQDHSEAIDRSLAWLDYSSEIAGSLIDTQADLIWRKVARKEPRKLSRRLQAAASRLHPAFRAPLIQRLFPPVSLDFESRPYHMGWILHAWPPQRAHQEDAA